jgi:hypothetical protein
MSDTLTLSQIGARIQGRLRRVLPDEDSRLTEQLGSPQGVGALLDALAVEPTPLRHALQALVAGFARQRVDLVRGYLRRAVPLPALAKDLLGFLSTVGPGCDPTAIRDSVAPIDRRLDQAISTRLPSQSDRLRLCGYGLGDGAYEQQLAERLAARGTGVELFGYDPSNACFDRERIQPCSLAMLRGPAAPRFDVVLARWVLHHVPPPERWEAFFACVHRCKPGGSLLLIEEGAFSDGKEPPALVYELLACGADVLVNSAFYPDWLGTGAVPGEHFYLCYLTPKDIAVLESAFAMPAKRQVEWHQAGYFPQILIRYRFQAQDSPGPVGRPTLSTRTAAREADKIPRRRPAPAPRDGRLKVPQGCYRARCPGGAAAGEEVAT